MDSRISIVGIIHVGTFGLYVLQGGRCVELEGYKRKKKKEKKNWACIAFKSRNVNILDKQIFLL